MPCSENTMILSDAIVRFSAEFAAYRANPQMGGWEQLRARIKTASRSCGVSAGELFSMVHKHYSESQARGASPLVQNR
jgi:hypothetical protein